MAGNNKGIVTKMTLEGEKIWDKKLHNGRCNFVQFSERQSWMMVTAGTEAGRGSVKVWDIRKIKDSGHQDSVLAELHHDDDVKSAYFSPQVRSILFSPPPQYSLSVRRQTAHHGPGQPAEDLPGAPLLPAEDHSSPSQEVHHCHSYQGLLAPPG